MKTIVLLLSLFVFGFYSNSQDVKFEDWDDDGDGKLERFEFTINFEDYYFDQTDATNRSGILEKGFFEQSYAGLDTDDDHYLTDEEWIIGFNYFFNGYIITGDISYLDANGDGRLSFEEFYDALSDTDYYSDIDLDKDTYISEHELANYVFENWDLNDSGIISKSEFKKFDKYYLDV